MQEQQKNDNVGIVEKMIMYEQQKKDNVGIVEK